MICSKAMSVRVGVWVCLVLVMATGVMGERRQRRAHRLNSKSSLDDLLNRLNDSIQEQRKRLERGLPTIHFRTDELPEVEEEPTIMQHWETEMTHPEYLNDVQPWTRTGSSSSPVMARRDLQMVQLAGDNARWVKENAKCEVPPQRCVTVTSQYPGDGYKYWPRCALLHRCGEDAGCCNAQGHSCAMAEEENVELYFFVYTQSGPGRAGVQRMTFSNHTRCACQPDTSAGRANNQAPITCKCPKHFTPTPVDGNCSCICPDGNSRCKRYKKGKRFFSSTEIERINTGECTPPTCEYGSFLLKEHRCPRRRERVRYTVSRRR